MNDESANVTLRGRKRMAGSGWANIAGRFLALIIVFAFFAVMVEDGRFYTLRNLENILRQSCVYATAGLGMTMVIVAAGIDLSAGSLIALSVVGVGMFGFTLSWDEIARTSQAIGDVNTLPLELQGLTSTVTTPSIYALGTVTTVVSLLVMGLALGLVRLLGRRKGSA